jgi:TRAP-type C4-dicarboxylate transport system permease small subunit
MTIAAAIFLIALGAILRYATNLHVEGVSVDTVGLILMIAGAAGLVLSFIQEAIWSRRRRADEVAPGPAVEERREVREPPPRY